MRIVLVLVLLGFVLGSFATDYHVGPSQALATIAEVPWEGLEPGDRVYIHWKDTPYFEKWVINVQGTEAEPIEIIGVSGPNGEQPIISGDGATTPPALNFWNEVRGVIKIGGSNSPEDNLPTHILIENLEVRSGHPDYSFTNDNGVVESYADNAAAIYVEKAAHLTIRGCTLHDCGNGLFIGAYDGQTQNILIENNYIHGNGIVGEYYEHNAYTSAIGITYQFNRFGPLRLGADGNNLKDRSAGLVVKYNWIEGGNRQLDLVDADGIPEVAGHPSYSETHVYGNILIEPDFDGNSQIIHYGGDSGTLDDYRKGILFFYNNTVISTRTSNTTLIRLSTNDETCSAFNNVLFATAGGLHLAMIAGDGTLELEHNWINASWKICHCDPDGMVDDVSGNIEGEDPGFVSFDEQNFRPVELSPLVDSGMDIPQDVANFYPFTQEYLEHLSNQNRWDDGLMDIGAFEFLSEVTGVGEMQSALFFLYPNPTADILNIELPGEEGGTFVLEITTISGQRVMREEITSHSTIQVSSLPVGIYRTAVYNTHYHHTGIFIKE